MESENLLGFVMRRLQESKGTWPAIARDTGLDYSWLTKVAQEQIEDPSVNKIQRLADYFRAREAA